jgi:hypothetical protein
MTNCALKLPLEIENLIYSFCDKFHYWESLPSVASIERLIAKSNKTLCRQLVLGGFIPPHVLRGLKQFSFAFMLSFENYEILERAISYCLNFCVHTSSLFWLFIQSSPSIYHGPYAKRFETQSLLFHLINITTMEPKAASESSYVCLERGDPIAGFSVSQI